MKKTCERCKAMMLKNPDGICTLGYPHEEYKPLVECPKPLTNTQLVEAVEYSDMPSTEKMENS